MSSLSEISQGNGEVWVLLKLCSSERETVDKKWCTIYVFRQESAILFAHYHIIKRSSVGRRGFLELFRYGYLNGFCLAMPTFDSDMFGGSFSLSPRALSFCMQFLRYQYMCGGKCRLVVYTHNDISCIKLTLSL